MNPIVIIPARGGSKGVPGKNIKELFGKPLIFYTIDAARSIFSDNRIIVSTDDLVIREKVETYGLSIPFMRPDALAKDDSPTYDTLLHAVNFVESNGFFPDIVVLLQPTSPFRNSLHIQEAINLFYSDKRTEMVVSVKLSEANPYYNLKEENKSGWLISTKKSNFTRRQDCPPVFELNGAIYVIRTSALKQRALHQLSNVKKYIMDSLSSTDIDNQLDWDFAEFLIQNKKVSI